MLVNKIKWRISRGASRFFILNCAYFCSKMAVPSFLNKNGSRDFLDKQKNLFDILHSVEKEKRTSSAHDEFMEVEQKSNKRKRKETKHFRGKESLFKEPVDLPLRFKKSYRVPDFQKNPHKWTKYSLADITQNEMSNESNTAAALSFLKQMKQIKNQKKQNEIKMNVTEYERKSNPTSTHQFTFHQKEEDSNEDSEKPIFKSSKLIMPEYVVGQAKKTTKLPKKKIPCEKGKEIYLNHIHEYEDE